MQTLIAFSVATSTFLLGILVGNTEAPQKVISVSTEIFSDSKTVAAIASAVFALLTLVVQFSIGSRQATIGTQQAEASRISSEAARVTALNAGDRAVAALRIEWITELRKTIAEYHSILMTSSTGTMSHEKHRRLSDLGTQLDLMLNLANEPQKRLWQVLDDIYKTQGLKKRQELDEALIEAGRIVMKDEWETIKKEMRGKQIL